MGPEYYLVDDTVYVPDHCHRKPTGDGSTPGDGKITIKQGTKKWDFTVNQEGPTEIVLPNPTLIIKQGGVEKGKFSVTDEGEIIIDLDAGGPPIPPEPPVKTLVYFGHSSLGAGQYRPLTADELKALAQHIEVTGDIKSMQFDLPTSPTKYYAYIAVPADIAGGLVLWERQNDATPTGLATNDGLPFDATIDGKAYKVWPPAIPFKAEAYFYFK